jgi:hypothetical protein
MSEHDSTTPAAAGKATRPARPSKLRRDFLLFPHAAGYWAKKVRGKLHSFGPHWKPDDHAAALAAADAAEEDYNRQADALHAGRKPCEEPDGERSTCEAW